MTDLRLSFVACRHVGYSLMAIHCILVVKSGCCCVVAVVGMNRVRARECKK